MMPIKKYKVLLRVSRVLEMEVQGRSAKVAESAALELFYGQRLDLFKQVGETKVAATARVLGESDAQAS